MIGIMDKIHIMDTKRSCLSHSDIAKYMSEITKQKNSPICEDLSTMDIVKIGITEIINAGFCLAEEQFDV